MICDLPKYYYGDQIKDGVAKRTDSSCEPGKKLVQTNNGKA
jgi:hypothetical protein